MNIVDSITCKLSELDEYLDRSDVIEGFSMDFCSPMISDDGCNIELFGCDIEIGEFGIVASEGEWFERDMMGELMPDFSLTMIRSIDGDYLYWEQDPPRVAIHNFMNGEYNMDAICVLKHKEVEKW